MKLFTQFTRAKFCTINRNVPSHYYDEFSIHDVNSELVVDCVQLQGPTPHALRFHVWNGEIEVLEVFRDVFEAVREERSVTADEFREILLSLGYAEDREFLREDLR